MKMINCQWNVALLVTFVSANRIIFPKMNVKFVFHWKRRNVVTKLTLLENCSTYKHEKYDFLLFLIKLNCFAAYKLGLMILVVVEKKKFSKYKLCKRELNRNWKKLSKLIEEAFYLHWSSYKTSPFHKKNSPKQTHSKLNIRCYFIIIVISFVFSSFLLGKILKNVSQEWGKMEEELELFAIHQTSNYYNLLFLSISIYSHSISNSIIFQTSRWIAKKSYK